MNAGAAEVPLMSERGRTRYADVSSVGIFWMIGNGEPSALLVDRSRLDSAESYGDCLKHAGGHFEIWERLKNRGARFLAGQGLPSAIAFCEYEDFPRGRVVYRTADERFVIYADRRLHGPDTIRRIAAAFGLTNSRVVVRTDAHYR